jgi:predicted RNA-binding protein with TRAM domain
VRFDRRRNFGRFRSRGRFDAPKPVKVGEEYDVEVSEIGAKGDGIARVNNFVVFVSDVKKGDKVKIKITEVRNRFAIGEKVGAAEAKAETSEEAKEVKPMEETEEKTEEEPEAAEAEEEAQEEAAEESETAEESEEESEAPAEEAETSEEEKEE